MCMTQDCVETILLIRISICIKYSQTSDIGGFLCRPSYNGWYHHIWYMYCCVVAVMWKFFLLLVLYVLVIRWKGITNDNENSNTVDRNCWFKTENQSAFRCEAEAEYVCAYDWFAHTVTRNYSAYCYQKPLGILLPQTIGHTGTRNHWTYWYRKPLDILVPEIIGHTGTRNH